MATTPLSPTQHLRPVLRLRDLVLYGIVIIQPTAPMPIFGAVSQTARGHVITAVLIALVAMLLTAVSYGRLARVYPSAGGGYTYVSKVLHPGLGYVTGWSIAMDYLLNPIVCTIWCAKATGNFFPYIPYPVLAIGFALLFTMLNLRGIESSAKLNEWMAACMGVVVLLFVGYAVNYLLRQHELNGAALLRPFYDPRTFTWPSLSAGTALAVLTYIGFDSVAALSEEAENPKRDILRATVLTCLITGILASIEVYLAQLIWPDYSHYPDVDTAFVHVAARAGGAFLFNLLNLTLIVATVGSGFGSQLAAARLLYSMGRDGAIPKRFFAQLDPRTSIPRNNVLFSGACALCGAMLMSYSLGAELLNFGAFISFMGVNAAACVQGLRERNGWRMAPLPVFGFLVCLYIWLSLSNPAKIAGFLWMAAGILYGASRGRLRQSASVISAG